MSNTTTEAAPPAKKKRPTTKPAETAVEAPESPQEAEGDTEATPPAKTRKRAERKPTPIMVEKAMNPDEEDPTKIRWLTGDATFDSTVAAQAAVAELAQPGLYRVVSIRSTFRVAVQQKPVVTIDPS